jgi:glycosidase
MQIFGRGLIRRLPPMLDGDPRRIRMVYSLLFSLPGTPVLFYGEEIGMGENLSAGDRLAVRSPMQWSDDRNGGFSTARPSRLVSPVVEGGFAAEHVNVDDQRRDPDSLLNFMSMLIRRYRQSPELGWASFEVLDQPHHDVLAHRCSWDDGSLVAVHNLAPEARTLTLQLDDCDDSCSLVDLLEPGRSALDEAGSTEISLDGYGYRWLRIARPGDRRLI